MKRTQIVDEADKWLTTNLKKRSALAVLVTDEENNGRLQTSTVMGGNWQMMMAVIYSLMEEKPEFAIAMAEVVDFYKASKK